MGAVKMHRHKDSFWVAGILCEHWINKGVVIDGNHLVAPSCLGYKMIFFVFTKFWRDQVLFNKLGVGKMDNIIVTTTITALY